MQNQFFLHFSCTIKHFTVFSILDLEPLVYFTFETRHGDFFLLTLERFSPFASSTMWPTFQL